MPFLLLLLLLARPRHTTCRIASAGRNRAARHPPNDPATTPPAIANPTAIATSSALIGACSATETVREKGSPAAAPPGPPGPPKPCPPERAAVRPGATLT